MAELDALLDRMKDADASDLHLKAGQAPRYRIKGELERLEGHPALTREKLHAMMVEILTDEQKKLLEARGGLDFGYGDMKRGRFRCNYYEDQDGPAAAFRRVPGTIPTLKELSLPASLETFAHLRSGLVLVTGATGSGKTTTLAAILDLINLRYRKHIITLEDPIEYLHDSRKSMVHQRGVDYDITDFASGIEAAMSEDPDVLLIGELRDPETIRLALSAAETGILTFATLHTNGAVASIDRIIDVFPAEEQPQIRAILGHSLAGVISQVLLTKADRSGRVPATEVLFGGPAVGTLIREAKTHELTSIMQVGKGQGMHTMDEALETLAGKGLVNPEEAYAYALNKSKFEKLIQ
jgi:twitching motility protein PilT